MRDRVLFYALIASLIVHLCAVCVIGRVKGPSDAASAIQKPNRLVKVDFVSSPEELEAKPPPVAQPMPDPQTERTIPYSTLPVPQPPSNAGGSRPPSHIVTPGREYPKPTSPGGGLRVITGPGGGVAVNSSGTSSQGWVPGDENGSGKGSGSTKGTGTPEPPAHVAAAPTMPAPPPPVVAPPPPAPKTVRIRVCRETGLLPGEDCETHVKSFEEGHEPDRTCTKCKKPEFKSTLAERVNPKLVRDARPSIPASVDEGLTLRVTVSYWVEKDGSVSGARISKSSGNRAVDQAVLSVAPKWEYEPAVQNGVPQRTSMTRSITIKT